MTAATIIAVVVTLIVADPSYLMQLPYLTARRLRRLRSAMQKIRAREIIDEAVKTAETKKREALLEVKEESIKTRNELEKEIKERRAEVQRTMSAEFYPKRNLWIRSWKSSRSGKQATQPKKKNSRKRTSEIEKSFMSRRVQELERISGLTSEQAKEYLLKTVEDEVKQ